MFKSENELWIFQSEVIHSRRYVYSKSTQEFLNEFRNKLKNNEAEIDKETILCRSQKGHDWRKINDILDEETETAFNSDRMKPLKDRAPEGRINPKGIPYLYLSNDIETSIAESRPWIGDFVSVGMFKVQRDLKLVHFTNEKKSSVIYLREVPKEKYDEIVWSEINSAFSEPITNNDQTAEYITTQVLSEIIKDEGYDGIVYSSKIGNGLNIALFNIDDAILSSCGLYQVKNINYEYEQSDNPYFLTPIKNDT